MGALALGIVLIIGYFYQSHHPYRRLELIRSTGYHIYFKAGLSGFVLLSISLSFWSIIDYFDLPSSFIEHLNLKDSIVYIKNGKHWADIKLVAIFALMFIFTLVYIGIRSCFKTDNESLNRVKKIAHELELLLIESTENVSPIRVELDCGKVYVGISEKPNIDRGEVSFIALFPLLSGYVNDEKKIIFNNNYYLHYEKYIHGNEFEEGDSHSSVADFSIVIPIEQIVVASRFSIDAFIQFRNDNDSELIGPPKPSE
ncbi:hypothetical protein tinsulaeT_10660 [Thalassotalea insulae]|uniref:Uncharacterized protein n=1 Tax=Thalassotalea insulae TaxID=2056778 RepID=A0ABQ6GPB1_9GAMM|nr:hypothetical protein [Thalassotalea insulae]GLX77726.1 hypothetical protein tinsulaeT_10660 [Thalassotalea insulae]